MSRMINKNNGFTLLELLIVISIVGILASVTIISYGSYQEKTRQKTAMQWSKSVHSLLGANAVGIWSFDNIIGNTVYDTSGKNNATVSGGVSVIGGAVGNGFNFNGANYINCGNSSSIKVTGSMTLTFWAKPNNIALPNRQNPICKAYGAEICITMETNGQLSYFHGSAGTNGSPYFGWGTTNVFNSNTWVHIGIIRNNATRRMYLYKNGKQVNTTTWASTYDPVASASYNFQIGAGYVNRFVGVIDEVRLFEEALSQSVIEQLYAQGLKDHQNLAIK